VQADSDAARIAAIDRALADWRQGDCVLGEQWFAYRVDPSVGLTVAARAAAKAGADLAETFVAGLVVVTQSCDVVRGCEDRPFVEVSPLVELDEDAFRDAERGRRLRYAVIPALADRRLVADLDRTMTVEKSVVARWQRISGCPSDEQARRFASALARKRERFAFPDDFTMLAKKLTARLTDKHDRKSDEGNALRSLREIRVRAAPSWDAQAVELMFWFIQEDGVGLPEPGLSEKQLSAWLALLVPAGRFTNVDGQVVTLDDMTARDYADSDPFDLDYLSSRETGGGDR
jgi:hypothetical protein